MITAINMHNWGSWRGEHRLEIKKPITVISAPNGSGKSSILSAIRYAITGSPCAPGITMGAQLACCSIEIDKGEPSGVEIRNKEKWILTGGTKMGFKENISQHIAHAYKINPGMAVAMADAALSQGTFLAMPHRDRLAYLAELDGAKKSLNSMLKDWFRSKERGGVDVPLNYKALESNDVMADIESAYKTLFDRRKVAKKDFTLAKEKADELATLSEQGGAVDVDAAKTELAALKSEWAKNLEARGELNGQHGQYTAIQRAQRDGALCPVLGTKCADLKGLDVANLMMAVAADLAICQTEGAEIQSKIDKLGDQLRNAGKTSHEAVVNARAAQVGLEEEVKGLELLVKALGPDGVKTQIEVSAGRVGEMLNAIVSELSGGEWMLEIKDSGIWLNKSGERIMENTLSYSERLKLSTIIQMAFAKLANVGIVLIDNLESCDTTSKGDIINLLIWALEEGHLKQAFVAAVPQGSVKGIKHELIDTVTITADKKIMEVV